MGNQNALGNEGGRPAIYDTPHELAAKVEEYFLSIKGEKGPGVDEWIKDPEPATITGLALFLGFCDRQSLNDYQEKVEFSFIIKRARARVEHRYERDLSTKNVTGAIFALKNMGWADKVENVNKNTNLNYNSVDMTPEEVKQIAKAFEEEF